MADLFNKTTKGYVDGFSLDKAKLTFSNFTGASGGNAAATTGLLIQNVQVNYQQQVSFVYDLTAPADVYYVSGRTQGTLQIGKVVGSAGTMKTFYTEFGDVCKMNASKNFTMSGITGCTATTGASGNIVIHQPLVTSVGFSMSVDNAVIGENCQLMFASLDLT